MEKDQFDIFLDSLTTSERKLAVQSYNHEMLHAIMEKIATYSDASDLNSVKHLAKLTLEGLK